jgi:hypothetical protein
MFLLAENNVDPAFGWKVLQVLIALLGGAIAWRSFFGPAAKRSIEPNPLVVTGAAQYALKAELDEVKEDVKDIEETLSDIEHSITAVKDALSIEGSKRASNLHQRIDGLQQQLGNLQGEMKHVANMVGELLKRGIHS